MTLKKSVFKESTTLLVRKIATELTKGELQYREVLNWESNDGNGWRATYLVAPELRLRALCQKYEDHFEWLKSAYPYVHPPFDNPKSSGNVGFWIWRTLNLVIEDNGRSLPTPESLASKALDYLWRGLDAKTFNVFVLCPLQTLKIDSEEIVVTKSVRLRRLSEKDVNSLYGGGLGYEFLQRNICSVGVEATFLNQTVTDIPKLLDDAQKIEDRISRTLRLIVDGDVVVQQTEFRTQPAWLPFAVGRDRNKCGESHGKHGHLRADKASLVPILYSHLEKLDKNTTKASSTLDLAIRRLCDAQGRSNPADKIIDSVIALEALLLFGSEQGEFSYKFRMNYAVLGKTLEDRLDRMEIANRLYKARSQISHGAPWKNIKIKNQSRTVEEMAEIALEVGREIVLKALTDDNFKFHEEGYWEKLLLNDSASSR